MAEADAKFKARLQAISTDTVEDSNEQRVMDLMAKKSCMEYLLFSNAY